MIIPKCPDCGMPMELKEHKGKTYWWCSEGECKYTGAPKVAKEMYYKMSPAYTLGDKGWADYDRQVKQ